MAAAVDAHCHLSDERLFPQRKSIVEYCVSQGVHWFVLGGVKPQEWLRQLDLQKEFPGKIFCSFGLHPYFVSEAPLEELEEAFLKLKTMTPQCSLIGELGLDFRTHILGERKHIQSDFFERQLAWARESGKSVVLHVVKAHEEALKILKEDCPMGMVHAFNSSWEIAVKYLDLGLSLSLGANALRPEHEDLVKKIPLNQMVLESDAPDQPPQGKKQHDPTTVLLLAQRVAANKGLTVDQVLEKTRENTEKLLGVRFTP